MGEIMLFMLYPAFQKLHSSVCPSVCLSVCLYVRPTVRQRIVFILCWEHFNHFFFKLAMRVDIGKECPGIADGLILANKLRVMALD